MKLKNKIALVTGGGSGIGQSIAFTLSAAGAKIYVIGRTESRLQKTLTMIRKAGHAGELFVADVSKAEDVKSMVRYIMEEEGKIDILVNNAAIVIKPALIENIREEEWDAVIAANLKGPFLCCREVVAHMKSCRSGRIINIGSTASFFTFTPILPYAASKGGLVSLSKLLAMELSSYGICVNTILPGPVGTGLWERATPQDKKDLIKTRIPLGRVAKPEEVANLACYLASDQAAYITGESIVLAGGLPGQALQDI